MGKALGITGYSGSGKTTLILRLIAHFRERGVSVSVVKHTHHPISTRPRGDTLSYLNAGAAEVLFASDTEVAVLAPGGAARVLQYSTPDQLTTVTTSEVVLVEGFKRAGSWPRIVLNREGANRLEPDGPLVVATVSDTPGGGVPHFAPHEVERLTRFVDKILAS